MIAFFSVYVVLVLVSLPFYWYQVVVSPFLSHVDPTLLAQNPKHNGILCLVELLGAVILAGLAWLIGGVLLGVNLEAIFRPAWLSAFSVVQFIFCTKLRTVLMNYYIEYIDELPRPPHKQTAVVDYDSFLVIHNSFYMLALSIALWLVG